MVSWPARYWPLVSWCSAVVSHHSGIGNSQNVTSDDTMQHHGIDHEWKRTLSLQPRVDCDKRVLRCDARDKRQVASLSIRKARTDRATQKADVRSLCSTHTPGTVRISCPSTANDTTAESGAWPPTKTYSIVMEPLDRQGISIRSWRAEAVTGAAASWNSRLCSRPAQTFPTR